MDGRHHGRGARASRPLARLAPAAPMLLALSLALLASARGARGEAVPAPADWRDRVIYQVITDRFATSSCTTASACDLNDWCGGTWNGLAAMSEYITLLGANAVWLSPVTLQGGPFYGVVGYHGYWPADWYKLEPHFGTLEGYKQLRKILHDRGMWLLQDVVLNHVGYGNWPEFNPFNKLSDFHDCNGCYTMDCSVTPTENYLSYYNYTPMEHCRLSGLPDLNHSDPSVAGRLFDWVKWLRDELQPDGLRLDATGHIRTEFLQELTRRNKDIWILGEWFIQYNTTWLGDMIKRNATTSLYNFPVYFGLRTAFGAAEDGSPKNMSALTVARNAMRRAFAFAPDVLQTLAVFLENHDTSRFTGLQPDLSQFTNAMSYVLLAEGIPTIYQGTEYGFTGGGPPGSMDQREPLWLTGYHADNPRWQLIWNLIRYRKAARIWEYPLADDVYSDDSTLVLARGPFVIVLNNRGAAAPLPAAALQLSGLPRAFAGRQLVDVLHPDSAPLTVDANGSAAAAAAPRNEPRVFYNGPLIAGRAGIQQVEKYAERRTYSLQVMIGLFAAFLAGVPLTMALTLLAMAAHARRTTAAAARTGGRGALKDGGCVQAKLIDVEMPYIASDGGALPSTTAASAARLASFRATAAAAAQLAHAGGGNVKSSGRTSLEGMPSMADYLAETLATSPSSGDEEFAAAGLRLHSRMVQPADELRALRAGSHTVVLCLGPAASMPPPPPEALTTSHGVPANNGAAGGGADPNHAAAPGPSRAPGCFSALARAAKRTSTGSAPLAAAAAAQAKFDLSSTRVLHVALEYALPHLGLNSELMFGGLGMVVATFMKEWPGPIALVAPLYKPCYDEKLPAQRSGNSGGGTGAAQAPIDRPAWIPAEALLLSLTVDTGPARGRQRVDVFKVVVGNAVYYLVQADLFRERTRGTIYSFDDEAEMLAWLAVFNHAVAAVVDEEGVTHLQLHDYHGATSLLHLPPEKRPATLLVGHNAHYNLCTPMPTPARRYFVYSVLGLNREEVAAMTEHKGSFDFLHAVVKYMLQEQDSYGVIAVSPRYAKQMASKLSVFWPLAAKPQRIGGILNALDMTDSLASSGMTLSEVLAAKAAAKQKLQEKLGLAVGAEWDLFVFMGRITQQKGCDIIAEAAPAFMAANPRIQLVHVGPLGDPLGTAAQAKLADLALLFPGRVFAPREGRYVSGDEKAMVVAATDFCLIPSRFEPCGLVDVEMGWQGAICVGHDTGGLGKMPGIYFKAQATHLPHWAAHLSAAVGDAARLPATARREMVADALSRRFPADVMMTQYASAWTKIDDARAKGAARTAVRRTRTAHHHAFFRQKWQEVNKKGDPSNAAGAGGSGWAAFRPQWGAASNVLLSMMQYWGVFPAVMLLALVMSQHIDQDNLESCSPLGIREVFAGKGALKLLYPAALTRVLMLLTFVSAAAAPLWFALAFALRPRNYIHVASGAVLASCLALMVACFVADAAYISAFAIGFFMLAPAPLLCMGFLGQEDTVEVSYAGRILMTVAEVTKAAACLVPMVLFVAETSQALNSVVPYMVLAGLATLVSSALLAWFIHPGTLNPAFDHQRLYLGWDTLALVRRLSCFWLSLLVSGTDYLALVTWSGLVLATHDLKDFAAVEAIQFGGAIIAIAWTYRFLTSRLGELRLSVAVLVLAGLPFYYLLKGLVAVYAPSLAVLLGVSFALDVMFAGRAGVAGLAGFVTLPSREVVAVWSMLSIWIGTVCIAFASLVFIGTKAAGTTAEAGPRTKAVALGVLAGVEGVRALAVLAMARVYNSQNLSAP